MRLINARAPCFHDFHHNTHLLYLFQSCMELLTPFRITSWTSLLGITFSSALIILCSVLSFYLPSTPTLPKDRQFLLLPTLCPFLFPPPLHFPNKANLYYPTIHRSVVFYWKVVDLSEVYFQRKLILSFPAAKNCQQLLGLGWNLMPNSALHGRIWACFRLCMS